jgi:fructokinase
VSPFGGIEAGGTKFVCAVGTGPDDLTAEARLPTTTPEETLAAVLTFFRQASAEARIEAVGIASFGPIDLDPESVTWGYLTATPKPGWRHVDLAGEVRRALGVPVGLDTDVNGAALAERRWGAARDVESAVYLTVGTGIGGGAVVAGRPLHGLVHPEMGHMLLARRADDDFEGTCPYHGACFEGLAAGPAIAARWGEPGERLPGDHPAWDLEAHYLAQGIANLVLALSPQRFVLGGGVMQTAGLIERVREEVPRLLGGYIVSPALGDGIRSYIVPAALGHRSGVLGALELARRRLCEDGA